MSDTASVGETVEYIEERDYLVDYEWASSGRLIIFYRPGDSHAGDAHIFEMRNLGYKIRDVNFRDNAIEWVSAD